MGMMDNVKAIFFDADDTLVDHKECERQGLMYLFSRIGISYKEEYQKIFRPLDRSLWEGTHDVSVSKVDIPAYRFKLLFESANIKYDDYARANELFMEGLSASTALTDNAEEVIKYLSKKGYMLCVVTNGLIKLQRPRVANSAIGGYISQIIVSEEVGAHKPNPVIFHELLSKIGFDAANVVMIGDSLEKDIQGAKNAGISTVWYNPERIRNNTAIVPDYEINDLLQIKDMF